MKICFIAPSGYGKTTAVNYLTNKYGAVNIKIADFLYEIQEYIYSRMGIDTKGKQDGELLQFLGKKIRSIDEDFLLQEFARKVDACESTFILNDDCRPFDYEFLKSIGFIFVRIDGYSHERGDLTEVDKDSNLEWRNLPSCEYVIDNNSGLEEYYGHLDKLMGEINNGQVLRYTSSKKV